MNHITEHKFDSKEARHLDNPIRRAILRPEKVLSDIAVAHSSTYLG